MKTIAAALLAIAVASTADATDIDWARIKPIDAPDMAWQSVQQGDRMRGMFAIPESDGVLLWMECAGKGAITLSYIDAGLEPLAKNYAVHMKSGDQIIAVGGQTKERLEMDDIVELKTSAIKDARFLANLQKGNPLTLVVVPGPKGSQGAFSLPSSGHALDPFFKSCGL